MFRQGFAGAVGAILAMSAPASATQITVQFPSASSTTTAA